VAVTRDPQSRHQGSALRNVRNAAAGRFTGLKSDACPFANLPENKGRDEKLPLAQTGAAEGNSSKVQQFNGSRPS
jgi:hypothetical protein